MPLTANADGTLTTKFTAQKDGFYRIELDAPGRRARDRVAAIHRSTCCPIRRRRFRCRSRDATPTPRRSRSSSSKRKAEDDYAVKNLQLVYSVNGGAEKTIHAVRRRASRAAEVTAGHTFYLEELGVQAGDSVSYYARASDNDAVDGAKQATSDIYFLRIRPFGKDFKPAASMAGGGGGGGGGGGRSRRAVAAAAADYLRHVQRPARSQDAQGRQVPRRAWSC